MTSDSSVPAERMPAPTVRVGPFDILALPESGVVRLVEQGWTRGDGGWIVTANVDIAQAASRNPELAGLVAEADYVVADGMPIVWAARMAGERLPERVTGAGLLYSLAGAAASASRSVYLLGGEPGIPEAAAQALQQRFPNLKVAGTYSPPFGFDRTSAGMEELVSRVAGAGPDLVFAGLGFPKQERTIQNLREVLPDAWYLGCGAGIPFAAGQFQRAPSVVQRMGAEWVHRLVLEPRRLGRRYIRHNAPFALRLLTGALLRNAADRLDPRSGVSASDD